LKLVSVTPATVIFWPFRKRWFPVPVKVTVPPLRTAPLAA
jgi:hypothetical protein